METQPTKENKTSKNMNDNIFKYIFLIMFIVIILIVVALLFYWFALRPASIKKDCAEKATERVKKFETLTIIREFNGSRTKAYDFLFSKCLNDHGL